ncbi:MAG: hypothetical protein KatS3mg010_1256 [Acidimicrobiia bacterium]|nr:MAG: hypothetical protein KatS3mg010_1256 [Acidimicrobiia bacterium]
MSRWSWETATDPATPLFGIGVVMSPRLRDAFSVVWAGAGSSVAQPYCPSNGRIASASPGSSPTSQCPESAMPFGIRILSTWLVPVLHPSGVPPTTIAPPRGAEFHPEPARSK